MNDISFLTKWKEDTPEIKKKILYQDMKASDLAFIDPALINAKNLEELETGWEKFMGMTKPFRRRSDWIMLDIIGCTNEDMYNELKQVILGGDLPKSKIVTPDDMLSESAFIPAADDINYEEVLAPVVHDPDFQNKVYEAEEWMMQTGFVVIIPIAIDHNGNSTERITNERWDFYNMLVKKHRRVSDWKSQELFGLTVPQIYTYLTSIYNKGNIENITPAEIEDETPFTYSSFLHNYCCGTLMDESAKEFGEVMVKLTRPTDNFTESINRAVLSDAIDKFKAQNVVNLDINYTDLPAFTPDEMIDLGIHSHSPEDSLFGVEGDLLLPGTEMLEWFELYEALYNGMPITDRYEELNRKRIQALEYAYRYGNPYLNYKGKNDSLLQGIVELGWNPAINFDPQTRVLVDNLTKNRIKNNFGESKIINLCGFETPEFSNETIFEDGSAGPLRPIYLCFEEGPTTFSKAIKAYTHGIYSHAALSFDHTMSKIYSFAVDSKGNSNGIKGGFVHENIRDKDPEKHYGIFAVFVDNDIFERIKKNVEYFIQNTKSTAYSYINILSIVFKIPVERNNKIICSQFVDRMLKLGGIDVTKKKSSLVDPNYLRNVSKANKNIYKVFEGKIKSFRPSIIAARMKNLGQKAHGFTGTMTEFALRENTCFYSSYLEQLNSLSEYVSTNSPLYPIYEYVYKPCFEAKVISLPENTGSSYQQNYFTILRDISTRRDKMIKEYNESQGTHKEIMAMSLRDLYSFICKEMSYVTRPNILKPLCESKQIIEQVLNIQ